MMRRRLMLETKKKKGLPSTYTQLEFIYNPSGAYIDCGIKPTYTFEYELKASLMSGVLVFGTQYTNDSSDYRLFQTQSKFFFDVGTQRLSGLSNSNFTYPYHVKVGNYYIELADTGERISATTFDEKMNNAALSSNLWLLFNNSSVKGNIYLFKVWDNGKLIRDYIPVRSKADNTVGLYDLVENKFYTSPNGIAFKGSDEVSATAFLEEESIE